MADGYEVWLAFRGRDAMAKLAEAAGVGIVDDEDGPDFDGGALPEVDAALKAAHGTALARMADAVPGEWRKVGEARGDDVWDTPHGRRRVSAFSLRVHYDPQEMGDRDGDLLAGVALSGRYVPVFLDVEEEHGGLHTLSLDAAFEAATRVAREEIAKAVPALAGASVVLKPMHY